MIDEILLFEVLNTIAVIFSITVGFVKLKQYLDKWIIRVNIDVLEFVLEPLFDSYPEIRQRINELKMRVGYR